MESVLEQIKVVILGDPGVGKSSILGQFIENSFQPHLESTVGVSFKSKEIQFPEKNIKLNVWDTAGQERYQSLTKMYCRGAGAAILVYDITKRDTFLNLKNWYQIVSEQGNEHTVLMVVGNKEDLIEREEVSLDEGREFAVKIGAGYKKTSAKTRTGIDEMFTTIAYKVFPDLMSSRTSSVKLDKGQVQVPVQSKTCCG